MGRFDNLLKQFEPIEQGDEAEFPATPRNALVDMLPESVQPYLAETIGDQKRFAQEFPSQVAGSTAGITKAQKLYGDTAGKILNKQAAAIPDMSLQAEHMGNLRKIQDFLKANEMGDLNEIGKGATRRAYDTVPESNQIIKPRRYDEASPLFNKSILKNAVKEQLIFNKIPEFTPKTNTYLTSKGAYQVQDKVLPLTESVPKVGSHKSTDWDTLHSLHDKDIDNLARAIETKTGGEIIPTDTTIQNVYKEPVSDLIKSLDVDRYRLVKQEKPFRLFGETASPARDPVRLQQIEELSNTLKKPQDVNISDPIKQYITRKTLNEAMSSPDMNYLNEILKLKGLGGK